MAALQNHHPNAAKSYSEKYIYTYTAYVMQTRSHNSTKFMFDILSSICGHWLSFESFWEVELKMAHYMGQTSGQIFQKLVLEKLKKNWKNNALYYLVPIKVGAPLNFTPLIFAALIFAHPQIWRPFNFCAPLIFAHPHFTVNLLFFHSFMAFFLLPLIFALSYCAKLLHLIFEQARCAKIWWVRNVMGMR